MVRVLGRITGAVEPRKCVACGELVEHFQVVYRMQSQGQLVSDGTSWLKALHPCIPLVADVSTAELEVFGDGGVA